MKIRKLAGAFALATVAMAVALPASAAKTLQFAHVYEMATPYHQAILKAAEELEARTEGRYEMKVFPASSLGKETAINEGLSLGTVDIIYTGVGFAANAYGPISISDYPFTLRGLNHWKSYRESDLFAELSDGYKNATGNEIVALTYYGARHVTANKPILTPADMKNLKIRVPNAPSYLLFPEAVGANPTPMAFAEVYLALQQGVVDAQENPLPTIQFKKFYEVQSNINLTAHITNSLITVVAGSTLSSMDEADRDILVEVLKDAADDASTQIETAEGELAEWFREQGNTVNEVDRAPFIDAVKPFLISDDMPWPSDVYERLQAIPDAS
ncbi:sialic acid TRAP transporter substrate-binding protein SiaP [Granulosicoccus antarcticus]|uniref:Sialic acid-binding periplasmic protein SiaP n=1 Tax=Granulosicoccus antarcticus IMCC3135 TaxID=1192854 RepID=A0A2Z2NS45_9GAMM|nr:sialic acid TRAP transporter substrate-binding protein SiaP [Granulosicoccus antarcticus]ASJ74089.1 Sialic acid-binding periplasmic protein SiaP [Granulosicoccus antarcticus IMCC3135]